SLEDQLLTQRAGHPGLARLRVASDEKVPAAHRQLERLAGLQRSQPYATASQPLGRNSGRGNDAPNVSSDGDRSFARHHLVRRAPQRLAAPGDGRTDLARLEQLMIVL